MGSARTGSSEQADFAEEVISFDAYNQTVVRGGWQRH